MYRICNDTILQAIDPALLPYEKGKAIYIWCAHRAGEIGPWPVDEDGRSIYIGEDGEAYVYIYIYVCIYYLCMYMRIFMDIHNTRMVVFDCAKWRPKN
jgi:hypothetical protein